MALKAIRFCKVARSATHILASQHLNFTTVTLNTTSRRRDTGCATIFFVCGSASQRPAESTAATVLSRGVAPAAFSGRLYEAGKQKKSSLNLITPNISETLNIGSGLQKSGLGFSILQAILKALKSWLTCRIAWASMSTLKPKPQLCKPRKLGFSWSNKGTLEKVNVPCLGVISHC